MATGTSPKILLTGATGFIGGTVLTNLLNSKAPVLKDATITCLVRGRDRVMRLSEAYGSRVRPVLYRDLDDLDTTATTASEHDLVINTTLGFHSESGKALLKGLAQRKAATGKDVWLIHTSGTSNIGDQPISGKYIDEVQEREFDDAKDDVYSYEQERNAIHPYAQRHAELGVIDTGLELGVQTLVIMSPTVFGIGSGLFNKSSVQIPVYAESTIAYGRGIVVGDGKGVCDHVHVEDLAELYKIAALDILEQGGAHLPSGKKGIIFSSNGRHTWSEFAQEVTDACYQAGKIPEHRVKSVSLAGSAKIIVLWGAIDETLVEYGFASSSRTISSVGRQLGWKPSRGNEAWKKGFADDVRVVIAKQ